MGKATRSKASKAGILTSDAVIKGVILDSDPLGVETPSKSIEIGGPPAKSHLIKSKGDLDVFGFGSETHSSFLLAYLDQGTNTKAEITEAFCDHFRMDRDGKATTDKTLGKRDDARKKSSMSVFFSDVVKPFGTYHASRSLVILTDKENNRVSLDPARSKLVKDAIAKGILTSLKGFSMAKHPEKVKAILKKYGLPHE